MFEATASFTMVRKIGRIREKSRTGWRNDWCQLWIKNEEPEEEKDKKRARREPGDFWEHQGGEV